MALDPLCAHYRAICLVGVLAVVLLAHSEGDVAVLDHMLDLLAHCGSKVSVCNA